MPLLGTTALINSVIMGIKSKQMKWNAALLLSYATVILMVHFICIGTSDGSSTNVIISEKGHEAIVTNDSNSLQNEVQDSMETEGIVLSNK